jgi:hypothetical protein
VPHEDGTLQEATPPEPTADRLRKAVEAFRAKEDDPDRALLLSAFAAQEAVEWPALDALLAQHGAES